MLDFIDVWINRQFRKYNTAEARARTQYEQELYWEAVARNVAPAAIKEDKSGDRVIINGSIYKRCVIVGIPPGDRINGYPKGMSTSFMNRLTELATGDSQLSISLKLIPIKGTDSTKMIKTAIFRNEVRQEDSKKRHAKDDERVTNLVDEDLKIERRHNLANFEAIVEDNEKHYHSSLILTMKSTSIDGLNALESSITSIMGSEGVECEIPYYRQLETFLSAQPYNVIPNYTKVQLLAPFAAVLVPGRNPNSRTGTKGLYFGNDRFTNKQIMVDLYALAAQHLLGVGPTGSGKSFTLLMLLMRIQAMLGLRIIFCTPKADESTNHRAVVDYLGDSAELIDIGPNGHNINPMQILYDRSQMKDDVNEYINAYNNHKGILTKFFNVWFDDTGSINMANFIDYSLNTVYENAGIYRDIPSTWHSAKWPVLSDLIAFWESELKKADTDDRKTIKAILNKTFSLGPKGALEFMNRPTDIDLSKDFIIIDLSNTPDLIQDAMNVLVTGIIGQRFRTDTKKKTIIAIDEARVFLQNPMLSKFLMTILTQGRSAGIALWLLTQQATDLVKGGVAEEFQTNIFLKMILGNNMTPDNIKHVSEYFGLDSTDIDNLYSSGVGEGLLVVGDSKIPIEFKPTELEMDIIKGAYLKNEKKEIALESNNLDERLIDLVMTHGYCLDQWAPESTVVQSWTREPVANAFGAGLITAWIRKKDMPSNQSLDHFSTVMQIAGQLARHGVEDVVVNHFDDADITFKSGEQTWAIEYERDGSHTEDDLKKKKYRMQRNYSNVMFVCASSYHKKLSNWLGADFVVQRGQALQDLIEAVE